MIERAVDLSCTALGYGLKSVLWALDHLEREPPPRIGASITIHRGRRRTSVRRRAA